MVVEVGWLSGCGLWVEFVADEGGGVEVGWLSGCDLWVESGAGVNVGYWLMGC